MKVRMLAVGLLCLIGLVGCAHQPVAQGGASEAMLGGTVETPSPAPAANGLMPYQQVLSDPGPF